VSSGHTIAVADLILAGLSEELLNASMAQSDIPDKLQVAHGIKTVLTTI
jgi:hypothetical protein